MLKTVLFSLVNKVKWFKVLLCITINLIKHQSFVYTQLNDQTVLFQIIQFSIWTQYKCQSSIWPIDRTFSVANTLGLSGPWSNGNKGILRIPQSSSIIRALASDYFVSYPGHSLGWGGVGSLQRCSRCIVQPSLDQLSQVNYLPSKCSKMAEKECMIRCRRWSTRQEEMNVSTRRFYLNNSV